MRFNYFLFFTKFSQCFFSKYLLMVRRKVSNDWFMLLEQMDVCNLIVDVIKTTIQSYFDVETGNYFFSLLYYHPVSVQANPGNGIVYHKCGIVYHICGNIVRHMWYSIPHLWHTKIFLGGIWRLKPMPKIQESFLHLESKRIFLKFLLEKKIPKIVFILSHLYTTKVVYYTTYVVQYATHVVYYTTFVVYKKSK